MIYRSNLTAPDLQPQFRHVTCRPMPHSMGHDVLSDFADYPANHPVFGLYKNCGFWTHDEAAILYNCAARAPRGNWLDIGAHTGWTAAHAAAAGQEVYALDNMLAVPEFAHRFTQNVRPGSGHIGYVYATTSEDFFSRIMPRTRTNFCGIVIDGDHNAPCPVEDAQSSAECLSRDGVILLHDFIGQPVRDATQWLIDNGFHCRIYWTPHMVACCWRGNFTPPDHRRDPKIDWAPHRAAMSDFPFERCE